MTKVYGEFRAKIHSFFKNVVFPAQAEYSYFSAVDFRLKIFLNYS